MNFSLMLLAEIQGCMNISKYFDEELAIAQ